jgi:hypothetical protein
MKNELTTTNQNGIRHASEVLANKCQTNVSTLSIILQGEKNRIKEAFETNETELRGQLQQIIFGVAEAYTNAKLTDADGITENGRFVLSECVSLCITKFNLLSASEIQEAFRQAAAGEINADLSVYGKFNVGMFAAVLRAYKAKRNKIRQTYDANQLLIEARKEDPRKDQLNEAAIEQLLADYSELVERVKNGDKIELSDIPVFWGENLAKCGRLNVPEDIRPDLFKECKKQAIFELKQSIQDIKKTPFQRNSLKVTLKAALKHIATGGDVGDVERIRAAATVIYKKAIVLKSIENDAE